MKISNNLINSDFKTLAHLKLVIKKLNMKKIFSFKYCFEDQPLNYLLVESDIPDNAFDIAEIWQKKKGINSKCSIQFHQKRFESPDLEPDDIINGQKVWELPF